MATTTTDADEFTRHCAWSGEDRPGMFYVLRTTHGEELVSEDAFRPVDGHVITALMKSMQALTRRVQQLERAAGVDQEHDQEENQDDDQEGDGKDEKRHQDGDQEHGQVAEHGTARAAKVPGQRTRKG